MKVVLTGTEGLTGPLTAALEAEGFEVESCPLVAIEELPIDAAVEGGDAGCTRPDHGSPAYRCSRHGSP